MPDLPLLVVAGPTGSGKSALALALAEQFGGEVLNFDSVQVYQGFDIGSAKVPAAERRGIRHHLLDVVPPDGLLSAGEFARLARSVLAEIAGRHHLPVLCGGTGFYLRALLDGLSEGPGRDDALRQALNRREQRRPGSIRRLLGRLDPEAAGRIHPNDIQKSIRALEIRIQSGRPAAAVFAGAPSTALKGYRVLKFGLEPDRAEFQAALDRRTEAIWRAGLLDEVRGLLAAGVPRDAKPFESLGYKQALGFLDGTFASEADALEEMSLRTRQYAKRQRTWFRADPAMEWLPGFGLEPYIAEIAIKRTFAFLRNFSEFAERFPG